jgi:hypothetical protein
MPELLLDVLVSETSGLKKTTSTYLEYNPSGVDSAGCPVYVHPLYKY